MSNLIIPMNVSDSDRSRGIFNQMSTKLVIWQFLETLFQRSMTKLLENIYLLLPFIQTYTFQV